MVADSSIATLLREQASERQRHVLRVAVQAARERGESLYLVGGAVRDLLRKGEFSDLDLVVEGDGLAFARSLATRLEAEARFHPRFLTAELDLGDLRVDVTSARRESYPSPAELPEIEIGSLSDDLARRDFTVNAMALGLWPDAAGALVDPFDGRGDLAQDLLRVLHDQSFFDDPTRILRGVRLASRLGLHLEGRTRELMQAASAAGAFEPLSTSRLRREIALMLAEHESVVESIRSLEELQVMSDLFPALEVGSERLQRLRDSTLLERDWSERHFPATPVQWWLARLLLLVSNQRRSTRIAVAERLGLEGVQRALVCGRHDAVAAARKVLLAPEVLPHAVHRTLSSLAPEELVSLASSDRAALREWFDRWLDELRHLRLAIDGEDLKARGFPEGPEIGRILEATLAARMDGRIRAEDELDFALGFLSEDPRP